MDLITREDEETAVKVNIAKMTKDLQAATLTLSDDEARFLVDAYYIIQEDRKRSFNQTRSMDIEPNAVLVWFAENNKVLENQIKRSLDTYSASKPAGVWARSIKGIGPVIAAGLLAHIDIEQAPTVGHIWRYAGLDPSMKWEKGQKRPWNASLKVLCWKIGESFCKFSTGDNPSPYGVHYRQQKAKYVTKNDAGGFAERAAKILTEKNYGKTTEAYGHYSSGKLPPAQIDMMAKRWATKLFLAHLHEFWYESHFKKPAPFPYPIAILGHAHKI